MQRFPILLVAGVVTGAACSSATPVDTQADEAAVRETVSQEVATANAGDLERFLAVFSSDAVVMPPNEPTVRGSELRDWVRGVMDQVSIQLASYSDEDIFVSGDLAYHRYAFEWTLAPKAGGSPMTERGHGLHILRKQADGSWKITVDTWSSSEPLPTAPPPAR
jgi:ketosteroid isomerase-like protein